MKKIYRYLAIAVASLSFSASLNAQSFTVADTVIDTTAGTGSLSGITNPSNYPYLVVNDTVTNTSTDSLEFVWNYLPTLSSIPTGWYLYGICDNITCYIHDYITSGQTHTTNKVGPNKTFSLQLNISAPVDAVDSVAIVKTQVSVVGQVDTTTFLVYKVGSITGVAQIPSGDKRVMLYPNPAQAGKIFIYTDKSVNAAKAVVYDINGRTILNNTLSNKEVSTVNVSSLSAGSYFVNIYNANGDLLANRRFVK